MNKIAMTMVAAMAATVIRGETVKSEPPHHGAAPRIEFENPLPAMRVKGRRNGTYNNTELALPGLLTTTDAGLGKFIHMLRNTIACERALVFVDGRKMMVNKNWIRDHVHTMKGMKHFEYDIQSFLDFIIDTQRADGQFYELVKQMDDDHWKFVDPDCRVMYPEDNLYIARLELEADVEYLVVEGAKYVYQISGDDAWLAKVLPKLEKSIDYMTSDPKRWNKEYELVVRPFSIDTWDFTPEISSARDRRIHADEKMSAMHGDNSGVYQAMKQLAWFNRRLKRETRAREWEARAEKLRASMFRHLWNGKFFFHQLHIGHAGLDNLERERMSLSCAYDMNRGLMSVDECRATIEEYMARRKTTKKFSEWFTVDPAYELFQTYKDGEYVNGALSPFTAGELAKAAFNNGYEEYGWDVIQRMMKLVERDGRVYFLYYPDSKPQPQGGPSAWGAAALISAVDEGLAGIVDEDVRYRVIRLSPKFPVTHYEELRYMTGYEKSGDVVDLRYILKENGMRYDLRSPAHTVKAHLLLPKGKSCAQLLVNGKPAAFKLTKVGESAYVDADVSADGKVSFEVFFGNAQ